MQQDENPDSFFRKYILFHFPGKTRFFQLPPETLTWHKVIGFSGFLIALYFGGGIVIIPWFVFGVIYYRVKFPRAEGGM